MLKALAQLGRACGGSATVTSHLEGAAGLRQAVPGLTAVLQSTLASRRSYSSQDAGSSSETPEAAPGPSSGASSSSSGGSKPSRSLQSKEWRNWIDTKLDSKLEAINQGGASKQAAAGVARPAKPAKAAAGGGGKAGSKAGAAAKAAATAAATAAAAPAPSPPSRRRSKGFELEQEIYSIIAPSRPIEEAAMPEGVTTYGQLAMASDAPRFLRAAANVADISPQRLHPTRLFFPHQNYAPAELDPYKTSDMAAVAAGNFQQPGPPLNPDEVTRLADYKNAPMLSLFLSEAGKLPVRSKTHLRAKLHRHYSRQVKIARTMGILPPTARWEPAGGSHQQGRYNNNRQLRPPPTQQQGGHPQGAYQQRQQQRT